MAPTTRNSRHQQSKSSPSGSTPTKESQKPSPHDGLDKTYRAPRGDGSRDGTGRSSSRTDEQVSRSDWSHEDRDEMRRANARAAADGDSDDLDFDSEVERYSSLDDDIEEDE